jgi:hypothetical protein
LAYKKRYEFTVMGKLPFPLDMLRYDRCYPVDGDSAAAIARSLDRDNRDTPRETYQVTLISDNPPTSGRWASFLWHVKE